MKKQIIGLMLFGFIVGAAALIYAVFNYPEIIQIRVSPDDTPERTHCKIQLRSKIDSIEVTQAIYNVRTKRFDAELTVSGNDAVIALHFFSNNDQGTHYIDTIQVSNDTENGKLELSSTSFEWFNKNKFDENFFVIAELVPEQIYITSDNQPKFDIKRAKAVTVDFGKR